MGQQLGGERPPGLRRWCTHQRYGNLEPERSRVLGDLDLLRFVGAIGMSL